jgi:hypothetical protein
MLNSLRILEIAVCKLVIAFDIQSERYGGFYIDALEEPSARIIRGCGGGGIDIRTRVNLSHDFDFLSNVRLAVLEQTEGVYPKAGNN